MQASRQAAERPHDLLERVGSSRPGPLRDRRAGGTNGGSAGTLQPACDVPALVADTADARGWACRCRARRAPERPPTTAPRDPPAGDADFLHDRGMCSPPFASSASTTSCRLGWRTPPGGNTSASATSSSEREEQPRRPPTRCRSRPRGAPAAGPSSTLPASSARNERRVSARASPRGRGPSGSAPSGASERGSRNTGT